MRAAAIYVSCQLSHAPKRNKRDYECSIPSLLCVPIEKNLEPVLVQSTGIGQYVGPLTMESFVRRVE